MRRPRLGQLLVARGWITGEQLIRAIQSQRAVGGRIGTCLLEMDALSEERLLEALASQLGAPSIRIEQLRTIDPEVLKLVPSPVARRCQVVPFAASRREIDVATLNVADLSILDEIAFCANRRVRAHVANEARLFEALERYYDVECPPRYGQLIDRLNRARYLWADGDAARAEGGGEEIVWQRPDEAFETPVTRGPDTGPAPIAAATPPPPDAEPAAPPGGDLLTQNRVEVLLASETDPRRIGDLLLRFLAQSFDRCALLTLRQGTARGLMGAGRGFDPARFADLAIAPESPSVLAELGPETPLYRGPLAPLPAHRRLVACWHGRLPRECVLVPVRVRGHLVSVIYADRGEGNPAGLGNDRLVRLAERAGEALERAILARKGGEATPS